MSVAYATRRLWVRRSRRTFYFLTRAFGYVAYALPPMWFFWFIGHGLNATQRRLMTT